MPTNNLFEMYRSHGQRMVERSAVAIADDIVAIVEQGMMFEDNAPEMGAGLVPVKPISDARRATKKRLGYSQPDVPRIATGAMVESIAVEPGTLIADVVIGSHEKAGRQQDGASGPWTDETGTQINANTPPRPFWGISIDALRSADSIVREQGDRMIQEMNSVRLDPIRLGF